MKMEHIRYLHVTYLLASRRQNFVPAAEAPLGILAVARLGRNAVPLAAVLVGLAFEPTWEAHGVGLKGQRQRLEAD